MIAIQLNQHFIEITNRGQYCDFSSSIDNAKSNTQKKLRS